MTKQHSFSLHWRHAPQFVKLQKIEEKIRVVKITEMGFSHLFSNKIAAIIEEMGKFDQNIKNRIEKFSLAKTFNFTQKKLLLLPSNVIFRAQKIVYRPYSPNEIILNL